MKCISPVWIIAITTLMASCNERPDPTTRIDVTLTNFQFSPNAFTVPAGKKITLNACNSGEVIHNFMIMSLGRTAGPEFNDEDLPNVYWKLELPRAGIPLPYLPRPGNRAMKNDSTQLCCPGIDV